MNFTPYIFILVLSFTGSPVHAEDFTPKTDFEKALINQDIDFMDQALREGFDPHVPVAREGLTCLMVAAANGKLKSIKKLLEYNTNIEQTDAYGSTAFQVAMEVGNLQAAKLLAKHNANLNVEDNELITPLLFAIKENKRDQLELLCNLGADFNKPSGLEKISPLMEAIRSDNGHLVPLLIRCGAKVDQLDLNQGTALHYVASKLIAKNPRGIFPLLEAGANINAQDDLGMTPLMLASVLGNIGIVAVLIVEGADQSISDKNGASALHAAFRAGNWQILSFLVVRKGLDYGYSLVGIPIGFLMSVFVAKRLGYYPKEDSETSEKTGALRLGDANQKAEKDVHRNRPGLHSGHGNCMQGQMNLPNPKNAARNERRRQEKLEKERLDEEYARRLKEKKEENDREFQANEEKNKKIKERKRVTAYLKKAGQVSSEQNAARQFERWMREINDELDSEVRDDKLIGETIASITNQPLNNADEDLRRRLTGLARRLESLNEDSLNGYAETLRLWLSGQA